MNGTFFCLARSWHPVKL
uniref:Uncharacterized protein n=1 Tax=Arundo donax TaxID=35708 RepID=A0A0A9GEQ1_ARUDO